MNLISLERDRLVKNSDSFTKKGGPGARKKGHHFQLVSNISILFQKRSDLKKRSSL